MNADKNNDSLINLEANIVDDRVFSIATGEYTRLRADKNREKPE